MTFLLINSSPDCDADRTCGFAGYFCGVVIFIIFVVSPGVAKFPPTKFSIRKIFHSHCSAVWIQTSDICYGYFSLLAPLRCLWSTGPLSQAAPCVMIEESEQRSEAGMKHNNSKKKKKWTVLLVHCGREGKVASWQPPQQADQQGCHSQVDITSAVIKIYCRVTKFEIEFWRPNPTSHENFHPWK